MSSLDFSDACRSSHELRGRRSQGRFGGPGALDLAFPGGGDALGRGDRLR